MSRINILILLSSIVLLLFVLELVRRRRLREEYSWLWLVISIAYIAVAIWPDLSNWVTQFLGVSSASLAFTILGLQFLILISIQYSTRLSRLTTQAKDLAQQLAILDSELTKLSELNADQSPQGLSERIQEVEGQIAQTHHQLTLLEGQLNKLVNLELERDG